MPASLPTAFGAFQVLRNKKLHPKHMVVQQRQQEVTCSDLVSVQSVDIRLRVNT